MLLKAKGISKSFGPKEVLRSVDLEIDEDDRIALVGPNGAGKSTLLKILTGVMRPDTGELTVRAQRIEYLPQFHEYENGTVEEIFEDAYEPATQARLRELEALMTSIVERPNLDLDGIANEYARLQEELAARRNYQVDEKKRTALERVGMSDRSGDDRIAELSGGETTRVMLARVLMEAETAELLILDEPTSHLDIESVESLEDYLLGFKGAVLVVSHDRYFLDRVAKEVWDLENGIVNRYSGNYTAFVAKKELEVAKQRIAYHKNKVERDRLLKIAEEQHLRSRYASTHKTRLKMMNRLEDIQAPPERKEVKIRLQEAAKSGKNFLWAKGLIVKRTGRTVLDGIDLELMVGDKLGVFGPNGSGKTTLLKALIKELGHEGELWVSPASKIGYFEQDHDGLDNRLTAEQQLLQTMGEDEQKKARAMLARLLLTDEQVIIPISKLSGGERAKVALALLTSEKRNLLLLDEPTNYLDLESREAVESALVEYAGTMILVTHDRYLLDSVCNMVAELREGKLRVFNGTYSEMKGAVAPSEFIAEANLYRVLSGFTDWTTKKKYKPGDKVAIAPMEMEKYQWLLDAGKIKRAGGTELKKVKRTF